MSISFYEKKITTLSQ